MCYDEGHLMAYADGELDDAQRAATRDHVAQCAQCAGVLEALEADRAHVHTALSSLDAELALAAAAPDRASQPVRTLAPAAPPARRMRWGLTWGRAVAAAAAVLVVSSFAFAPVRGVAAGILRIFRVEQVSTIEFTEQDLQEIEAAFNGQQGHIDLRSLGEAWVEGGEQAPSEMSIEEAQAAVDFPLVFPEGVTAPPTVALQPAQNYKFKLDVDAVNELLAAYGSSATFPDEIDGKTFEVKIPEIVLANYSLTPAEAGVPGGGGPESSYAHMVSVAQARSPELIVPEGVDPLALRDVIINLPIIPEHIRAQLASVGDWQNTLLVPSIGGSSREVDLGGVTAVVVGEPQVDGAETPPGNEPGYLYCSVVWNDDGVIRGMSGDISEDRAIELAKTMIR